MRRIKLTVAYDGTDYCGWQYQPGKPTIEGVLNEELSRLLGEDIRVIGASRTDAGVHAEGAVCVFDAESKIPGEKFSYALNRSLPEDIVIRASCEVSPDFHPRRTASRKTYRYSIWHDEFMLPTLSRYTHWVYTPLDIEAMKQACEYFAGEHDFKSFCSVHTQAESTVRTIYDMHIEAGGDFNRAFTKPRYYGKIDIFVTGNGFLYNMVRIIAGTLIEVGQKKLLPENICDIIQSGDRSCAGNTAPAKGLTLVGYDTEAL